MVRVSRFPILNGLKKSSSYIHSYVDFVAFTLDATVSVGPLLCERSGNGMLA